MIQVVPTDIDVFLSYGRKDLERVKPLARMLEGRGWRVWWDEDLRVGRPFDREIERAIAAARCVVVVWTPASVDSDWVRAEAAAALEADKLVPVFLDTVRAPLRFRHIQGLNLAGWDGSGDWPACRRLITDIARLAGAPVGSPADSPPASADGSAGQAAATPEPDPERATPVRPGPGSAAPAPAIMVPPGGDRSARRPRRVGPAPVGSAARTSVRAVSRVPGILLKTVTVAALLLTVIGVVRYRYDARSPAAVPPTALEVPRPATDLPQTAIEGIAAGMVEIPGGTFQMGCSPGDGQCEGDEQPPHQVRVPSFRMGKFEVTQAQWQAVTGTNPARFKGDERPVENVSWDDAQDFLTRLNQASSGQPYRLPSEAEWEYAARADTQTPYWWGKDLGKGNANCYECGSQWDNKETAPVGSFKPNAFGLYDTVGNVWEWVQDCYHESYMGAPSDGSVWVVDSCTAGRVLRGGSWSDNAGLTRVSYRIRATPGYRNGRLGLRLAQDL